jgi:hypothetical protein
MILPKIQPTSYKLATLSWNHINPERNLKVFSQGELNCIWIDAYGGGAWFSPILGVYPSRQDLAKIVDLGYVLI